MGQKLRPDIHLANTNLQLIIKSNRGSGDLYLVEFVDQKGYKFVNRGIVFPMITFGGNTYINVNATIHLKLKTITTEPDVFYLQIDQSQIAPVIPINTFIDFKVPFRTKAPNEVVTVQDVNNILGNKSEILTIGGVQLYGGIDNLLGGVSSSNTYWKEIATITNSNSVPTPINGYLEAIDGVAEMMVQFPNISGKVSTLAIIKFKQDRNTNTWGTYDRFVIEQEMNSHYGDLFSIGLSLRYDTPTTSAATKLQLKDLGIFFNRPFNLADSATTANLDTVRIFIKRRSNEEPDFSAGTVGTGYLPFHHRNTSFPNGMILRSSTLELANGLVTKTKPLLIDGDFTPGITTLDFNWLVYAEEIVFKASSSGRYPTLQNKPADFNPATSNKFWKIVNDFSNFKNDSMTQELHVYARPGIIFEIYRRSYDGTSFTPWLKVVKHTHTSDEVTTSPDRQFVSQAEKNAWNTAANTTWLAPVVNVAALATISNPALGSAVVVRSESAIYVYQGGASWKKQYELASLTQDGLLSATLYADIMGLLNSNNQPIQTNFTKILMFLNQHSIVETDYVESTIDMVMRADHTSTDFSKKSVAFGAATQPGAGAILGNSVDSVMFGMDTTISDSLRATVVGSNITVANKDNVTAIGSGLEMSNTTIAIGTYNEGSEFFEVGVGTDNNNRRNLFSVNQQGGFQIRQGFNTELTTAPEYQNFTPNQFKQVVFNAAGGITNFAQLLGVDINQYPGDFGQRLQAALTDSQPGTILDARFAFPDINVSGAPKWIINWPTTNGIRIDKPIKILLPGGEILFTNYSTNNMTSYNRHMFIITSSQVTIEGTGRSSNEAKLINVTRLVMEDKFGGYHVHSRGNDFLTLRSMDLSGNRTGNYDAQEDSATKPIDGAGGVYIEKADPGTTTSGNTVSNITLESLLISKTKYHGVYIDTPIISVMKDVRVSSGGGHGIFINGGTSIRIESCYVSSTHKGGFVLYGHSYSNILSCASEYSGIGYWLRGCFNISIISSGAESNGNRAQTIPNGNLTTTDALGNLITISDVGGDNVGLFRGTSFVVSGGQALSLINVASINAGRPTGAGVTNTSRDILVRGNARDVLISSPRTSVHSGSSFTGRFNIAFEALGQDIPSNCELVYNPMNSGTVTPGVPDQWISNVNNDANKAPVFLPANSNILVRSGRMFFTELIGPGFGSLEWSAQNW